MIKCWQIECMFDIVNELLERGGVHYINDLNSFSWYSPQEFCECIDLLCNRGKLFYSEAPYGTVYGYPGSAAALMCYVANGE